MPSLRLLAFLLLLGLCAGTLEAIAQAADRVPDTGAGTICSSPRK